MTVDFVPSSDRNSEGYRGKRSLFLLRPTNTFEMSQTVINAVKKKNETKKRKGHIEINTTSVSLLAKTIRSYDLG